MRDFNEMLKRYKSTLKWFASRQSMGSQANYKDALQEAHIVLWKCCVQFREDRSASFLHYLKTSLKYRYRNLYSRVGARAERLMVYEDGDEEIPVRSFTPVVGEPRMKSAMEKLSEREQKILTAIAGQQEEYSVIGEEFGISRQRVHQLYVKAARDLRKELSDENY